jgi:hypothetical protein
LSACEGLKNDFEEPFKGVFGVKNKGKRKNFG